MSDPLLGSEQERAAYREHISGMVQDDIEQRRQERKSEFARTRESPAVLQGAVGSPGSLIQSLVNG